MSLHPFASGLRTGKHATPSLCIVGPSSLFLPFAKPRQTPKSPATSSCSAPATSASSAPASTPTSSSASARSTRSSPSSARRWTRSARSSSCPRSIPRELWEESGRWTGMGDNMFRLKDRKGADLCLGMTHEEVMTDIARKRAAQLQAAAADLVPDPDQVPRRAAAQVRPAARAPVHHEGRLLLRHRRGRARRELRQARRTPIARIFTRCGLKFVAVEADSGAMGGSQSQEFMVYTDAGEDLIASCAVCGYAANLEKATSQPRRRSKTWRRPATASRSWSTRRAARPSQTSPRSSRSPRHPTSSAWPTWR